MLNVTLVNDYIMKIKTLIFNVKEYVKCYFNKSFQE